MDARRWHYERCNWYFVCVLPLSYLVTFSNHGFQFVTEVETSKNKNSGGLWFWVFFHHSREESLVWDYLFHLPEKYYLPSPDKEGGNDNCVWILIETRSELEWLKSRCLHALLWRAITMKFSYFYYKIYLECSFLCPKNRE